MSDGYDRGYAHCLLYFSFIYITAQITHNKMDTGTHREINSQNNDNDADAHSSINGQNNDNDTDAHSSINGQNDNDTDQSTDKKLSPTEPPENITGNQTML